jgi:hypothetical protein
VVKFLPMPNSQSSCGHKHFAYAHARAKMMDNWALNLWQL